MFRRSSKKPLQPKLNRSISTKSRTSTSKLSNRRVSTSSSHLTASQPSIFTAKSRQFSSADRSGLKPLPKGPQNLAQLELMRQSTKPSTLADLQAKVSEMSQDHEAQKAKQTKSITGNSKVADLLSNQENEVSLKELNQSVNIAPPPTHITRHLHSPYFIPMWDPELRQSKELITSFENSTKLKFEDMDLIGSSLDLTQQINLRQRFITKNKVSLVQVISTSGPFEYAQITAEVWANHFANHGHSNQDGTIIVEPTIINITEGLLQGWFRKSLNYKTAQELSPMLKQSTISFHITSDDDATSRARRFLDCRNRFVDNLFLVDERGMIRWRAALATVPDAKFMETLFNVTNDLILETKFDEAD